MTENEFISDKTQNLIENLSIEKLFSSNEIKFDSVQQQFILKGSK